MNLSDYIYCATGRFNWFVYGTMALGCNPYALSIASSPGLGTWTE